MILSSRFDQSAHTYQKAHGLVFAKFIKNSAKRLILPHLKLGEGKLQRTTRERLGNDLNLLISEFTAQDSQPFEIPEFR